ncbi:MAG: PleD family two-component system response regulator [Hyphomicrobium sp.]|nr:PleD family two-component system response regulator [Hyphomicrobium sp.]
MTARVLVVDDILANVKLLEARLSADYFQVVTAFNGPDALNICASQRIDVVLLDVMMPGMDGFEVCRRIKSNAATQHVPVIMVTALDQPSDKIQGLDSGADDFLTKPVDDIALITRVKNLARLKMLNDEMLMRASTSRQMGLEDSAELQKALSARAGRMLLVDDHPRSAARLVEVISKSHDVFVERDCNAALLKLAEHNFDLLIVSLSLSNADGLRLCSQVRSLDRTRHLPIIILVEPGDEARLLRGMDMGVNDYLMRPVDRHELLARIRTQIKRKRFSDYLRNRLEESVELAITDPLTGLHNRRYMESHLRTLVEDAIRSGRLKEFAARLKRNTRGIDLACRLGGEEFLIIMPETDMVRAYQVAERTRAMIASEPFQLRPDLKLRVTASVGLATLESPDDTPETIFKRADNALYAAKRRGRNRVAADAA